MTNKMRPIHPGEILKDEMDELDINASNLAKMLAVPANRITSIIAGDRSVSADTALRLSRFFGTTPQFWLSLQSAYDLKITEKKMGKKIVKDIHPYYEAA